MDTTRIAGTSSSYGYFLCLFLDTFGELYADLYAYFENDSIALFLIS